MKEELKKFSIDIDGIPVNDNLFDNIHKAINELREKQVYGNLEVILNNNLISVKDKISNYRTIFGCKVSYEDLERNISFIVKEDTKPTYEQLEQLQNNWNELKNIIEKGIIDSKAGSSQQYYFNTIYKYMQELEQVKD